LKLYLHLFALLPKRKNQQKLYLKALYTKNFDSKIIYQNQAPHPLQHNQHM